MAALTKQHFEGMDFIAELAKSRVDDIPKHQKTLGIDTWNKCYDFYRIDVKWHDQKGIIKENIERKKKNKKNPELYLFNLIPLLYIRVSQANRIYRQ